jgi:superfamily II DNA/RNA helicase
VVPSRELALQIEQVFKSMGTGFKISCCYGGHKREIEENNLIQPPALIVGTAGRISDHIRRGNITVDAIETLVLDEFDKSLELGFVEEMSFIIQSLKSLKKKLLTSATEAIEIPAFVGLQEPVTLNFLPPGNETTEALTLKTVYSPEKDKVDTLFKLIARSAIDPLSFFAIIVSPLRERASSWLKKELPILFTMALWSKR